VFRLRSEIRAVIAQQAIISNVQTQHNTCTNVLTLHGTCRHNVEL
jgi:hypothetical protein